MFTAGKLLFVGVVCATVARFSCMKKSDHLILQGTRCISRCLQTYADELSSARLYSNNSTKLNSYKSCVLASSSKCAACIQPCTRHFRTLPMCMQYCDENLECMYSCAYFSDISGIKMGYCPAPTVTMPSDDLLSQSFVRKNTSIGQSSCISSCQGDYDCKSNRKCCMMDCQRTCQRPKVRKTWLPKRLEQGSVRIRERPDQQAAVLFWQQNNGHIYPSWTMFLVQQQSQLSKGIPERFRKWQTIIQTAEHRLTLVHLRRGYWYKFRVAAVNVNGTKGFSVLQQPFKLSAAPRRPPEPSDLEQVSIRILSGAKYNLQLRWKLPNYADSDLPIRGFHVTWHQVGKNGNRVRHAAVKRSFYKIAPNARIYKSTQWTLWIKKLRLFARYSVTVVTSSGWVNGTLFSTAAAITVTFPHLKPSEEIINLKAETPFIIRENVVDVNVSWHFRFTEAPESIVRFMVEWERRSCLDSSITKHKEHDLTSNVRMLLNGLQMGCKYTVSVEAWYGSLRNQWSGRTGISFATPTCGVNESLLAATNNDSCQMGKVSSQVRKLGQTQLASTSSTLISWKNPDFSEIATNQQLLGYFVYYNVGEEKRNLTWTTVHVKAVPYWKIPNDEESSSYVVHVLPVFADRRNGSESVLEVLQ